MTRKRVAGTLVLGISLVAAAALAPGVARAQDGAVVDELRQLKEALVEMMNYWQRQSFVDERSRVLRDIDVMDRNIAFMDGERLRLVEERASLQEQIDVAAQTEEQFQRQVSSELGEALSSQLEGRLARSRAAVSAKEERMAEVQQRIDELARDIARRRSQRSVLESELDELLPTGS